MRSLRLLLVTVSTAMLVGVSMAAVVAQSGDEGSYLTGTMTFVEDIDAGVATQPEGLLEVRGASAAYDLQMSNPSVSGTLTTHDYSLDGYGGDRLEVGGGVDLFTADGAWTGNATGVFEPTMGWQILYRLDGQDELDGLTFFLHAASPEMADGVWEMDGFVVGESLAE
jgi:hypothetical protein